MKNVMATVGVSGREQKMAYLFMKEECHMQWRTRKRSAKKQIIGKCLIMPLHMAPFYTVSIYNHVDETEIYIERENVPNIPPLIVESIDVRFLRRRADSSCCSVIEVELGFK